MNDLLKYFPNRIKKYLLEKDLKNFEEIRIRVDKPIILKKCNNEEILECSISQDEIFEILHLLCENSIYSYQNQISKGFITIPGGHRIGITGSCVIENEKIININYINSLNFRISKSIIGAGNNVLNNIIKFSENTIFNTMIVAIPCAGKTTVLRDLIRQISNGFQGFCGLNIGVVDERNEIASLYKGLPQNDIGIRTDVIENISKSEGVRMLVRSMSPDIIAVDELGSLEDINAVYYAICSGCRGIFTAHGSCFKDLINNPIFKELLNMKIIEKIVFLDEKNKGMVKKLYNLDKNLSLYGEEKNVIF